MINSVPIFQLERGTNQTCGHLTREISTMEAAKKIYTLRPRKTILNSTNLEMVGAPTA